MERNEQIIIGMMSGTSVDSIDAALCRISESGAGRLVASVDAFVECPVPRTLRDRIFRLFQDGPGALSLACSLNFEIGAAFADAALAIIDAAGVPRDSIAAIASHGQTVYHIAPHMVAGGTEIPTDPGAIASTLQIGEASVIAERTGVRVVCDFRVADMAAGGNGAPLVPFADHHLFSRPGETVIVHNIGGIANCTVLPATGRLDDVLAFDTGPGNMMIDALVQHFYPDESYDRHGAHARAGAVIEPLLSQWMNIPYVSAAPPKTTGRELFGVQLAHEAVCHHPGTRPDDLIATATEFAARSMAVNFVRHVFGRWPATDILVGGGGARNVYLMERIAANLHRLDPRRDVPVHPLDDIGFDSKARECIAFAMLGYARLHGILGNVPSATGARHPALLGKIVDPPGVPPAR